MSLPQITFQVRTRSRTTPSDMVIRVGAILGCRFAPSSDRMFDDGHAVQASVLGLQVTLSWLPEPEGSHMYIVMAAPRADIEAQWGGGGDAPQLSIGPYILGVMRICGGDGWYIPTFEEHLTEAGLSSASD